MFYILTFLSILTLGNSFGKEFIDDFDRKVNDAYSEYTAIEHYDESYPYGIKLVRGIIAGEVRYGFCFYSAQSKDYYVRVSYQGKLYRVSTDSRGDVQAVALNLKEGDTFSIIVYNSRSETQEPISTFKDIKIMSKAEFENLESKQSGLGKGVKLTRLESEFNMSPETWYLIVAVLIILACVLIVYIYYKKRQGLFNQEIRSQNAFNFREFISSNFGITDQNSEPYEEADYEVIDDDYQDEVDEDKAEEKDEDQESYFEEHYSWARDEDERSGFNITEYLQNKGYVTDYSVLSENEKNQIMLELMRLKDEKRITRDEYLEETAKLWKK